jgi:IMP dehydrogenase/GMP reductase
MKILYYEKIEFRTGNHIDENISFAYTDEKGKLKKMISGIYGGVIELMKVAKAKNIKDLPSFKDKNLDQVIDIYNKNN